MLSASSRRLRCYIAAASDLCASNFGPNSAPNRYPIHKPNERNDFSLVSQLVQVAVASRRQPLNSTCFLTVAKAFAKSDDCGELLRLTKQVMKMTSPNMTIINRVFFAFGECGEIDKALLIFAQMKALNFVPDLYRGLRSLP
ncbi:PREDICTED: pentatricopeptide repeat-containing [Prunus dulcis]|uniref:PREDICTED: pentatricopeptide repeat-containing n=1 Tax=Prunus dulcis TaxID=3755 RepID=A0A5E4FTY4_PRUDU|nr:PREDICTED: pentatricopeptide repeat-containing [Prunus dulcis]